MEAISSRNSARRIITIAAFTWLEARRTRLPWMTLGLAAVLLAASVFARSIALTESTRLQLSFLASTIRFTAVFIVCLHVLGSLLREAQDRGTEFLLAIDLSRTEYLLGRTLGHMGVALAICTVLWAPVPMLASPAASLAWLASLVMEAWIVVAASIFCAITLNQLMPACAFVFGLYLLARGMAAILLIATASPFMAADWSHAVLERSLRAVSLLLPGLDRFTQSLWLTDVAPDLSQLAGLAAQAIPYVALLFAAALFDLYRKNY